MARGHNQLRSGVFLSYVNMILGMLIPFFYTPVMLRMLGRAEYGLFSLSSSVVSYLGLLSFGFGNTVIRYIAKYRAEEDKESIQKTYGFFVLLYSAMALLVVIFGVILANHIEPVFHKGLTDAEQTRMCTLVLIMTISTALSFPLSIVSAVIGAHERFIFRNLINIVSTVVSPLANLLALWMGYRSVGMAVASLILQFAFLPWNIVYCRKVLHIKPKYALVEKNLFMEMVNVSFFNFLASIVDMLFWATDKVILGMLASTIAVAVYNVGATFNSMVTSLSTAISGVLAPKVTGMIVKNATHSELTELFVRVGRLQFLIIGLVVSGFTVFGRQFINIWVGNDYADAYIIALLTMLPLCIPLIQNTGITILIAQNKQKFRSILYFAIALLNVVTTYLVVPQMGGIGAALCSCVSYLLGQGIIMNIYYYRVTNLDIPMFWKTILKTAIIPITLTALCLIITNYFVINNWILFFFSVAAYTAVYILLMWHFAMNDYEKGIIKKPILDLFNKIRRKKETGL